jgi:hypothetical protein
METNARRQELEDLERSVLRIERLLYRQGQVIAELERDGNDMTVRSAWSLYRAFETGHKQQVARRDWLRTKLGWYGSKEDRSLPR